MVERLVVIMAADSETLDGVSEYLRDHGSRTRSVRSFDELPASLEGVDSILLFADDYPRDEAVGAFAHLLRFRNLRIVVVTSQSDAFRPPKASTPEVAVLARPAWGWTLVEALRGDDVRSRRSSARTRRR